MVDEDLWEGTGGRRYPAIKVQHIAVGECKMEIRDQGRTGS